MVSQTAALDAITSLVDHLAPPTTTQKPNHRPLDTRLGLADLLGPAQGALPSQQLTYPQNAGSPLLPSQGTGILRPIGDRQVANPSGALSSDGRGTGHGDKHDGHAQGKGQAALVSREHGTESNLDAAPPKGREKRKTRGPSGGKTEKGLADIEPGQGRGKRRRGEETNQGAGLNTGEAEAVDGEGSGTGKGDSAETQERLARLLATTTSAVVSGGSSQGQSQGQSLAGMSPPDGGDSDASADASGMEELFQEENPGTATQGGGSGSCRTKGKSRQAAPKRSSLAQNMQGGKAMGKITVRPIAPRQDASAPARPSRNRQPPQAFWVGGSVQAATSAHSSDPQEANPVWEGKHGTSPPPSSSATDKPEAKEVATANLSGARDGDAGGKSKGERGEPSHSSSGGERKSQEKGPGPREGAEGKGRIPQEQGDQQVKSKPPRKSRAANPRVQRGNLNEDAGTMAKPTGKMTGGKGVHNHMDSLEDSSLLDAHPEQGNDAGKDQGVADLVSDPACPGGDMGAGRSTAAAEHAANVDPLAGGAAGSKRKSEGKGASPSQPEARQPPAKGGRGSTGLRKKGGVPGTSHPVSPDGAHSAGKLPAEAQAAMQGHEGRASQLGQSSAATEKVSKKEGAVNIENEVPEGRARRPVRQRANAVPYWMGTAAARGASHSPSAVASPKTNQPAVNARLGAGKPAEQNNDAVDKPAQPAGPPPKGPSPGAGEQVGKPARPGADAQEADQAPAPKAQLRRITKRQVPVDGDAEGGAPAHVKETKGAGLSPKRQRTGKHQGTGADEQHGIGDVVEGASKGLMPAANRTKPAEVLAKADTAVAGAFSPKRRKSGTRAGDSDEGGIASGAGPLSADGPQPFVGPSPKRPRRARASTKAAGPSDVGTDMQPPPADGGATEQEIQADIGVSDSTMPEALQRDVGLGVQPSSKIGVQEEAREAAASNWIGSRTSRDGPVDNQAQGSKGNAAAQPTSNVGPHDHIITIFCGGRVISTAMRLHGCKTPVMPTVNAREVHVVRSRRCFCLSEPHC